ncbi:TniB family NTP-binding protein [Piscinibacter gummiphilus]|uniref:Uncharacterized protein n=1 Tax=Piscinibacter gummiphilus TaxID=946333 RepID=A0A1W6L2Q0_9BURK|nr:TniB family NTP-binding protein [Piscinibacter gummiphilus]ARN18438.1 hypothetical protein A4W93_00060 [Piscinibacter gummiphilus]ATU63067.1 transposition helper protein [Piscinibacter gummiphilus]GLS98273.1 hypothetical protein GCM10007918_55650 [Piscinibacter gummiphilus]
MSSANELRRRIESCKLNHQKFLLHYEWLGERIEDALAGFAPRVEWVVGPSRAGKSMLMEALSVDHPEFRVDGVRRVPVLYMPLSRAISPKSFPTLVLEALKVPVRRREGAADLELHAAEQLQRLGTKVLLLDEASHFVEPAARLLPRSAGDMLKVLSDRAGLSIFMTGIPRLQLLIDSNDQLRQRATAKRELLPYNFNEDAQQEAFAQCVRTYADMFAECGWPIDVPFKGLVKNCYLHSGGLVGSLSKFMQELCIRPRTEEPRPLTLHDCKQASERAGGTRNPLNTPFANEEVSDAHLNQAYQYILDIEPLPNVRRR